MTDSSIQTQSRNRHAGLHLVIAGMSLAGAFALASPVPAGASTPDLASGSFTFTSDTQIPTRFPGGNVVISETSKLAYTGDLSGTATDTDSFVAHADGTFQGHGIEVCDPCALWGRVGAFTSSFTFRGAGDSYVGQETVLTSTGGLSGLHGTGTFQGLVAENVNSYSYNVQIG